MARVEKGELCIFRETPSEFSIEGQQLTFWSSSIPKSLRGFAQILSTKVTLNLKEKLEFLRQHSAPNFRHRAELLYLECWKGTRILGKSATVWNLICIE